MDKAALRACLPRLQGILIPFPSKGHFGCAARGRKAGGKRLVPCPPFSAPCLAAVRFQPVLVMLFYEQPARSGLFLKEQGKSRERAGRPFGFSPGSRGPFRNLRTSAGGTDALKRTGPGRLLYAGRFKAGLACIHCTERKSDRRGNWNG